MPFQLVEPPGSALQMLHAVGLYVKCLSKASGVAGN